MDQILNTISRLKSVWSAAKTPTDEERARRDSTAADGQVVDYRHLGIEPSPDLHMYRMLVGITQDSSFRAPSGFKPDAMPIPTTTRRPAPNMGIYTRVYAAEIKCKKNYKSTSRLISSCLGLQIIVAAALTALGAAGGSSKAVTVFGAINTVIAGFLTYLKGSGLPNRIKYYQHQWGKIREYIEQRERDLQCGRSFDILTEVETIRQMYEDVKLDIEMSQPERFVGNSRAQGQQAVPPPSIARPAATLQKSFSDASSSAHQLFDGQTQKYKSGFNEKVREYGDLEKGLESFGRNWFHDKQTEAKTAINKTQGQYANQVTGLKARLEDRIRDIGHMEKEVETHGRVAWDEKVDETRSTLQSTVREVDGIGREIDASVRAVVADGTHAASDVYTQNREAAHDAITDRANAARAAILEQELAAKAAVASGQTAANDAIAEHAAAASAAVVQSEAATRTAVRDFVDRSFDAVGGSSQGGGGAGPPPGGVPPHA